MMKDKTPEEHALEREQFGEIEWTVTPEQAKKIKGNRVKKILKKALGK